MSLRSGFPSRAFRTVWRQRHSYGSWRAWFARLYNGLLNRFPGIPLPGRGGTWSVTLRGFEHPFFVRQGSKDWATLNGVLFQDEYGFVLERLPRTVERIVDLGSNIGLTVRLWLRHFPQAQVVAVEPDPENLSLCRRNVAVSGRQGNVIFRRCCVARARGVCYLDRRGEHTTYHSLPTQEPGAIEVPGQTLNDLLEILPSDPIDLLKCDIEGAEREVFGNPAPALSRVRHLAIELHDGYTLEALVSDLAGAEIKPEVLFHRRLRPGLELALLRLTADPSHGT